MVQVLIQAEAGSRERRVYDESTLEYLDTQPTAAPYPYPYGFVIGTRTADGDCLDCYLITTERPLAGTIVECDPIGLLCQEEDGQPDHKILASLPGREVALTDEITQELQTFIARLFAAFPATHLQVGPILPQGAALDHLRDARA
jgi:inorganic pyrophosphatase